MVSIHKVTVMHDGVICNNTHALSVISAKHTGWHPPVSQMHGCHYDNDQGILVTATALLLLQYMDWFWPGGHFCQDLTIS